MNVFLPVERLVVAELAEHGVSTKARPWQAFLNRLRRLRSDRHMLFATAAGILHPLMLDHLQPSRNQLQLLARFDTDLVAELAAARTGSFRLRKFMTNDFPFQMFRQLANPATPLAAFATSWRVVFIFQQIVVMRLFELRGEFLEFFQGEEQQLFGIDAFLPRATDTLQQELDLMFQRRNLLLLFFQRGGELLRDGFVLRLGLFQRKKQTLVSGRLTSVCKKCVASMHQLAKANRLRRRTLPRSMPRNNIVNSSPRISADF